MDECSYEAAGIGIGMASDYGSRIHNAGPGVAVDVSNMSKAQEDRTAVGDSPLVQALG